MNNFAHSITDVPLIRPRADQWVGQWVRIAAVLLVVTLPLAVTPWGTDAYHQPKVLILYGLTAIILLGWLVACALGRAPRWVTTGPELAIWAFLFAILVSSIFSVNLRLTLFGAPARYEGVLAWLAYTALFFCGVHFFGSASAFGGLVRAVAITATAVSLYATAQAFFPPLFQGEAFMQSWYSGLGMPRSGSTLGSPVALGGYLAFLLPLILATAVTSNQYAWLLASITAVVALLLTLSRGAWLAAAVAYGLMMVMAGEVRGRAVGVTMAAALALGVAILVARVGTAESVTARATSTVAVHSGSVASRLYIWRQTAVLVGQRPWTGWGIETLREVFPYRRVELVKHFGPRPVIIDKAHNDVLQVAVSIGLPGAAAYLAIWVSLLGAAMRLRRRVTGIDRVIAAGWLAALAGYLVQAQFAFSVVGFAPIVWLLAGAAAGWESKTV